MKFYICDFEWVFVIEVPFIIDSKLLSKLWKLYIQKMEKNREL